MSIIDKVASAGTAIVDAIAIAVLVPNSLAANLNVTSAALEPSTLETKTELTLYTFPEEAAFVRRTVVNVVVSAPTTVSPKILVTFTIFGFAIIITPWLFYPKTIDIAIAFPVVIPAVAKDNAPEPLVTIACPLVPSAVGKVKDKLEVTVAPALNDT